jgi:hypothetical protein
VSALTASIAYQCSGLVIWIGISTIVRRVIMSNETVSADSQDRGAVSEGTVKKGGMNPINHRANRPTTPRGSRIDPISGEEFDHLAEAGSEELDKYMQWDKATRPNLKIRRINLDLPEHFINKLDAVAVYIGVPRQAVIKMAIDAFLESRASVKNASRTPTPSDF